MEKADEGALRARSRRRMEIASRVAMLIVIIVQSVLLWRWGVISEESRRVMRLAGWQQEYVAGLASGYNAAAFACIQARDGHGQTAEYEKQHVTEWVLSEAKKRAGPRPE